ncbi:unnamed protein product [Bursaphelenchus okinawaensis]|uniref:DOMON domain-containing protein n=1 Tax=Bursaphelenchus okinawaensis TaxID=465554 RepID=A0A811KCK1_9BILA|nr:unnamed protein product [Bursaphelenchus okinawaensis]CAG9098384.1 unnamed protein product [Bursaphelenchus okinawaensis]
MIRFWAFAPIFVSLFCLIQAEEALTVWLVQPASRSQEREANITRLTEVKCPTPKNDKDPKTTLPAGGVVEIIWQNPAKLHGEARFEILSGEEIIQRIAVDKSPAELKNGQSVKSVKLPEFECKGCTLRLTQFTDSSDFQIISCADIDLLPLASNGNTTECTSNAECGKDGACESNVCYCSIGKFGRNCEKTSSLKTLSKDLKFKELPIKDKKMNKVSWSYDPKAEELQMVVDMAADSWVALGLKNKEAAAKCSASIDKPFKDNSLVDDSLGNTIAPALNIKKLTSTTKSHKAEPGKCGPNEVYSSCPEFSRECEPSCEWTLYPESVPTCPRTCGEPRCICDEGFVRVNSESNECKPFDFCAQVQLDQKQCKHNETWAKCGTACEPSCDTMYNTDPCTATCKEAQCTCADNYVRFNGECIFWGDCPNLEEKRLVPSEPEAPLTTVSAATGTVKPDVKCATNETWNECGRICEADCVSIFTREECQECSQPTCSCQQGFARSNGQCVYWGDCPLDGHIDENLKQLTTNLPEIVQTDTATNAANTQSSPAVSPELVVELPPSDPEMQCFGEFAYPNKCEGDKCSYRLSWAYVPEKDNVEFSLETRLAGSGWSGVGFSRVGNMQDADFLLVKSDGKKISVHDMHTDGYNPPLEDKSIDVESPETVGTHADGILKATFTRKRQTADKDDVAFGDLDEQCYYFLFPVGGGNLTDEGGIAYHAVTPLVSAKKVCVRSCVGQTVEETPATHQPTYTCQNEYRHPADCFGEECDYIAKWNYVPADKSVHFEVSAKGIGRWTGIGFSRDGQMTNSDIVTGWVHNKKAYVLDRFAYGRQSPAIDPADRQDLYNISGSAVDDVQTISFQRKLVTADKKSDFPLDKCYYFVFPVGGGRILAQNNGQYENPKTPIAYHDRQAPERTAVPVCICHNDKPVGETPAPAQVRLRRQTDPFDEKLTSGELGPLFTSADKTGESKDDPFACSDVALVEVSKNYKLRVYDGFALSTSNMHPDESFGGAQSFVDVAVVPSDEKDRAKVVIKRKVKSEDISDFTLNDEPGTFVVAAGKGGSPVSDAKFVETFPVNFLKPEQTVTTVKPTTTTTKAPTTPEAVQTTVELKPTTEAETEAVETTEATKLTTKIITTIETTTEVPFEATALLDVEPEVEKVEVKDKKTEKKPESSQNKKTTAATKSTEATQKSTEQARTTEAATDSVKTTESATEASKVTEGVKASESTIATEASESPIEISDLEVVNIPTKAPEVQERWFGDAGDANCASIYSYPANCTNNCQFSAEWALNEQKTALKFQIHAHLKPAEWTAIGFTKDGAMADMDTVVVSVLEDGTISVSDQYSPAYGRPRVDKKQDLRNIDAKYTDGHLLATFVRDLATNDDDDHDLNDCHYFVFAQEGGSLEAGSGEIRKHKDTPDRSKTRICPKKCGIPEETTTAKPTPAPPATTVKVATANAGFNPRPDVELMPAKEKEFDAAVRVMNKPYQLEMARLDSDTSTALTRDLMKHLKPAVEEKYKSLEEFKITNYAYATTMSIGITEPDGSDKPSILALIRMRFSGGGDSPTAQELQDFLKEAAAKGANEELTIDPQAIQVILADKKTDEKWAPLKSIKNVVIVVAVILATIVLVALMCCCLCMRRKKTHPEPMSFGPPAGATYQPYAANYAANLGAASTTTYDSQKGTEVSKVSGPPPHSGTLIRRTDSQHSEVPKGIGEATYQEWYHKVASKETPAHHQESVYQTPPNRMAITQGQSPVYVSYPPDVPSGYYTMTPDNRMPPPSYYRHY